jgi:small subunit ribosomal protein S1
MQTQDTSSKNTAALLNPATILKNEISNLNWPREGGVVEAAFIKTFARQAFFDLGAFGTGVVFGVEFLNARDIVRNLKPGDKISAKVNRLDGEDGYIELSLTEAGKQRVWQQVQDLQESGEIIPVKVTGVTLGGVLVNVFDLRGFLPVSQMATDHYPKSPSDNQAQVSEELKGLIGETVNVKVINVNSKKNKLIVSERDTVNVNVKELLSKYSVGQLVEGVVSGIADFGIFVKFVDNPQIEGLIHISEIDHRLVDNPKEAVAMNETVTVKIIDIREGKVFLSLKALKSDPWEKAADHFKAGMVTTGSVYKFNPFGAVINLDGGVQGLIHVSEFGSMEEMKKTLDANASHSFLIESVKPEEKRIILKNIKK